MMDLMTEIEAAARLKMSPLTLAEKRRAGMISHSKIHGSRGVRYTEDDILEYISATRVKAFVQPVQKMTFRQAGANSEKNRQALLDVL